MSQPHVAWCLTNRNHPMAKTNSPFCACRCCSTTSLEWFLNDGRLCFKKHVSVSNSIFFVTHFQVSGSFMINYSIYPAWKLPAGTSWAEQNSRLPWRIESLGSRCPLHSSCCLWQLGGVPNLGTGSSRHLWFCVGCSRCVSFFLIGSAPVSSGGFRTWHHPQTRCKRHQFCCDVPRPGGAMKAIAVKYPVSWNIGGFLSHGESPSHHGFQCSNGLLLDDLGGVQGLPRFGNFHMSRDASSAWRMPLATVGRRQ